jgi:hypothetical protein
MTETLETLKAQQAVLETPGDLAVAAHLLDTLSEYEQIAELCAAAMTAEGGMVDAVDAALESVALSQVTRKGLLRGSSLELDVIGVTKLSCERSESLCGAHAHHHDHCRRHAEAARTAIGALEARARDLAA